MNYRPDVDGLRAISIFLILVYHVNNSVVPGGFVGVDIFFVISGYLITHLIWGGLQSGNFSFVDFYAKRIRRIFPALLLVLVSTIAMGWNSLFAHEFMLMGKHVAASAAFVSNMVYQLEGGTLISSLLKSRCSIFGLWQLKSNSILCGRSFCGLHGAVFPLTTKTLKPPSFELSLAFVCCRC